MSLHDNNDEQTRSYSILAIGTVIGRYTIIDKIGSGGMGEVYLADDSELDRRVALKFLPDRLLDDEQAMARFRREAQATARLNHPNIVTIHEVGDHRGHPFIAMEYIQGETLDSRIKREELTPDEVTGIIIQVARGLQAAHDMGVIHRDIKPGNICICRDGRAKVLDFGLARVADSDSLTHSKLVMGTLGYSSPEQISGSAVDLRTDIWSLGILIFKMLTGKLPFEGENAKEVMYSIINSRPSDISRIRDDIPFPLQPLYRRCIEKNPGKRPQSMNEVLDILGSDSAPQGFVRRGDGGLRVRKLMLALLIMIFVVVFAWSLRTYLSDQAGQGGRDVWRVGILPFNDQTGQTEVSGWPSIIQALMVGNLTGVTHLGIVDPLSLNAILESKFDKLPPPRNQDLFRILRGADLAYVIDGTIVRAGKGFQLHSKVIDPLAGEVVYSCMGTAEGEEALARIVDTLSSDILAFFQTMILHEDYDRDIRPWLSYRSQNLDALKAFMQANEFIFNGISGSERYLNYALKLDSNFVAPRIYLISGLVMRGAIEEARMHYAKLLADENEANPFERAMIEWAGALIENDARRQANSLTLALEYSPGNNVLLYELARSLYSLEEFEQAAATLRPAIDHQWKYSPAYYLLGITYCRLREYSKARHVLERSLAVSPVYEHIYGILAGVALKEGDSAASERFEKNYINELEARGMSRGEIYAALANSHLSMDLDGDAIRCYRSAVSSQPDQPEFHKELGRLLFQSGDWAEAGGEFNLVLGLDSACTEAYRMLAIIHDSLADTSKAVRYYGEYLIRDSACSDADRLKNRLRSLQGQP